MDKNNIPVNLTGKVNIKKESEGKKFFKLFFAGSFSDAMRYAFDNVLIPYTKDAICKTSTNVVSYWVNGDKPVTQTTGASRVSYWNGVNNQRLSYTSTQPAQNPKTQNNVYNYSTLYFDDRGDAEAVLLRLKENLAVYHAVSVADLYELSGEKSFFTDYKYGWRNLDSAYVGRTTNGKFVIELPKASPLE